MISLLTHACRDLEDARWMWFEDAPNRPPRGPYRTDELLRKLDRREAYLDQLVTEGGGRPPVPMSALFVRLEPGRSRRREDSLERREWRGREERSRRWPRSSSDPREDRRRSRSRSKEREDSSRRWSREPERRYARESVDRRRTPERRNERREPDEEGEINGTEPEARVDQVDPKLHLQVQERLEALMVRIPVPQDPGKVELEHVSKGLARLEKYSDFDFPGSGYCEFAARGAKTSILDEKGMLASTGTLARGLTPVIDKRQAKVMDRTPGPPQTTPQEEAQRADLPVAELAMYKPDSESSSESEKSVISWSDRPSKGASVQGATSKRPREMEGDRPSRDQPLSEPRSVSPEKTRVEKRADKAKKRQRLAELRSDPTTGEWFFFGWDLKEHGPYQFNEVQELVGVGKLPVGLSIHRREDDLWLQVFPNAPLPTKEDLCLDMQEVLKVQDLAKTNDPEDIDEWFEKEAKLAEDSSLQEKILRVRAPPQFKARYCGKLQELLLRACRRHFVERAIDRRLAQAREKRRQHMQTQRQTAPTIVGRQVPSTTALGKLPPPPRVEEEKTQLPVGMTPPTTKARGGPSSGQGTGTDAGMGSQSKIQAILKKEAELVSEELEPLVQSLAKADARGFFQEPVTDELAPDYSSIIKEPMDFTKIKDKLHKGVYPKGLQGLNAVKKDVALMFRNCMVYNPESTEYHQEAKRLMRHSEVAFNRMEKKIQQDLVRLGQAL
eukprot:scaffold348_cov329-Pavlova_lutheri.AAC.36